ncbi:hypothetical protein M7I_0378 [Glarea lozoyensis 74030]|uniref:Uncharacterized protein n=1 Tax=Glarea lozoyensis (strain ATCC 74030 / MF5533) TaxID=1104152 RepID=H0ED77_GLAL7|nr:hypothetical protein M7I_0378 [Glarea lozoyensis 74030]
MGSSAGAHSFDNSFKSPLSISYTHLGQTLTLFLAIIESGGATARACLPYDNEMHETQFNDFLGNLGLLQTPPKKVFDVLRTIPTSKIKDASEKVFIHASDIEALGKTYPDPLTDEKSTFKELRTSDDIGPQYTRLEQAYGHFAYVNPVRQTVHYASKSAPVWLYRFEVNSRYEGGADHGDHDDFVTYNEDVRAESPSIREIRNSEIAGGKEKGMAVKIEEDTWRRKECQYWDERTELFES